MKRILLFLALIMFWGVVVGNSTKNNLCQNTEQEILKTAEVEWWFERDYDREGKVIGKAIIVENHTNKPVNVTFVISENGKRDTISVYVPAREKRRAWYGNSTLKVHGDPTFEDAY